jgi:carbon storage regulator
MLVLSRKVGEKIIVAGSIEVSIVSLDRGKVRIGISAPPEVSVHRKEVFDRILEFANHETSASPDDPCPADSHH